METDERTDRKIDGSAGEHWAEPVNKKHNFFVPTDKTHKIQEIPIKINQLEGDTIIQFALLFDWPLKVNYIKNINKSKSHTNVLKTFTYFCHKNNSMNTNIYEPNCFSRHVINYVFINFNGKLENFTYRQLGGV